MTWSQFLTEAISLIVGGITGVATGIGGGLSTLVTSLAYEGTGNDKTMSAFMAVIFVFCGISLAITLCRWCVNLLSSLGNRNR